MYQVIASDENHEEIDPKTLPWRLRFPLWLVNYFNFGHATPLILRLFLGKPSGERQ